MHRFQHLKELISHAFQTFSENMACDDLSIRLTYAELENKSEAIQRTITPFKANSGIRIGLCAPKSTDSYAALLAVLNAECCLVPFDNLSPFSRKIQIIKDSQLQGLIAERSLVDVILLEIGEVAVVEIESTDLFYISFPNKQITNVRKDLAYILYTSGSTGIPKGVMITHKNVLSFVHWATEQFDFSENDIFSSVAPFYFDLSFFDLFVSIYHGAEVVLFNDQCIRNPMMLASKVAEKNISVWYSTPTILMLMNRYGKLHKYDQQSLRSVLYAGEVFPLDQLKELKSKWKRTDFYNLYGPTETNVCTWTKVPECISNSYDTSLIGVSCHHVKCNVLFDQEIKDPEVGLEGELVVSGDSVSSGYTSNQQTSDSKFLLDSEGILWYKTGDIVKVISDRNFKYLGRTDRMIKKRGYRIELDEIQHAIQKHPSIERVAIMVQAKSGEMIISAHCESSNGELNLPSLKAYTCKILPEYMLPDEYRYVEKLPLTSTHKIDYQKLKESKGG